MKKLLAIIIAFFSISFASSNEKKSTLSIENIIGGLTEKYKTEFIVEETVFDKKIYSVKIDGFQINIFEKYYANANIDMDDWYNSKDMKYLYTQVESNKSVSYNFGINTTTSFANKKYITNYFVFAIGDLQDMRLERFVILFSHDKAIIIQIADSNIEKYLEELSLRNYIIKTDGFSWNSHEAIVSLLDDLSQCKLANTNIQQYHNFSEKILSNGLKSAAGLHIEFQTNEI